jgi:hypothetical protein
MTERIRLIEHQMQPCPVSCVSTCLAMLKGIPASVVIEKWHDVYRECNTAMRTILDDLGIQFKSFDTCENSSLCEIGAYLVTAPSLNIIAGTHQILIEVTEDDYFVIDPVKGRDDRKFYVKRGHSECNPLAVELGGFMIDAFIPVEWLAARP